MAGVISSLLALGSVVVFMAGLLGLLMPRLARLRRRRHALALAGFSLVMIGFGIDLDPPKGQSTDQHLGLSLSVIWAGLVFVGWLLPRFVRSAREKASTLQSGAREISSSVESALATASAELKRWGERARSQADLDDAGKLRRWASSASSADKAALADRIFRIEIVSDADETAEYDPATAPSRKPKARGNYLGPSIKTGPTGHQLQFEYADQYGEITVRTIRRWIEFDRYVRGWCETAEDFRDFRKDRVLTWLGGEEALLHR